MTSASMSSSIKSKALSMTVLKADGRRINLGVWSYTSTNPVKHWATNAWIKVKGWWFRGKI